MKKALRPLMNTRSEEEFSARSVPRSNTAKPSGELLEDAVREGHL